MPHCIRHMEGQQAGNEGGGGGRQGKAGGGSQRIERRHRAEEGSHRV